MNIITIEMTNKYLQTILAALFTFKVEPKIIFSVIRQKHSHERICYYLN